MKKSVVGMNVLHALEGLSREECLKILAEVIESLGDLDFVAELVRKDFEPTMTAESMYESNVYDEGDDTSGHVSLGDVLEFAEDILTKSSNYNISFSHFVRPETDEERDENGHTTVDIWYAEDERIKIGDLELQFETA